MRATGLLAVKRFGLGGRPGEVAEAAADPKQWLLASIREGTDTRLKEMRSTKPGDPVKAPQTTLDTWLNIRRFEIEEYISRRVDGVARKDAKPPVQPVAASAAQPNAMQPGGMQANGMQSGGATVTPAVANAAAPAPTTPQPPKLQNPVGPLYNAEVEARFVEARVTRRPLVERLAWFWSNHFAIGVQKGQMIRALAGPYEREAIRPHVLGRFRDMVAAVVRHPAMLDYLDNARSIGPESLVGRWKKKGLNENLARELMELHVLGVDAGYSQADVTNLARILTGWTVGDLDTLEPGRTVFMANAHDPGPITVLGKTYQPDGAAQLDQVLDDLVRHPAAGRFVARKLVAHFVGPTAPPTLVPRLADVFTRTGGDLGAVTRALVTDDDAWVEGGQRVIPPWDFAVATARALETDLPIGMVFRLTDVLAQKTWDVPSPQGWTETEDWGNPAALVERLDWSDEIARRFVATRDVRQLADAVIGPTLSTDTATAIARAESRQQALALLLMSPEMQRR